MDDDETDAIVLFDDLADLFDREEQRNPSAISLSSVDIVKGLPKSKIVSGRSFGVPSDLNRPKIRLAISNDIFRRGN
jgi:hypothetical protein